jgi:hypothetical protein
VPADLSALGGNARRVMLGFRPMLGNVCRYGFAQDFRHIGAVFSYSRREVGFEARGFVAEFAQFKADDAVVVCHVFLVTCSH